MKEERKKKDETSRHKKMDETSQCVESCVVNVVGFSKFSTVTDNVALRPVWFHEFVEFMFAEICNFEC